MEFWLLVAFVPPLSDVGEFLEERFVQSAHRRPIHTAHESPAHGEANFSDMGKPTQPDGIVRVLDERAHDHWTVKPAASSTLETLAWGMGAGQGWGRLTLRSQRSSLVRRSGELNTTAGGRLCSSPNQES
jgi:hypothetical protein